MHHARRHSIASSFRNKSEVFLMVHCSIKTTLHYFQQQLHISDEVVTCRHDQTDCSQHMKPVTGQLCQHSCKFHKTTRTNS